VDGYGPRWQLWLVGPVAMSACCSGNGVAAVARNSLSAEFRRDLQLSDAIPVALMGAIELFMLCMALGVRLDVARIIPALVFVMLILMGNPMGKVRRNFFIGIRTPWTLASERWYATHRLAGKLMVGVACWACSLPLGAPHWLLLVLMMAWGPLAAGYSLVRYKRLPQ
jgi:uncharacterized membrane protein